MKIINTMANKTILLILTFALGLLISCSDISTGPGSNSNQSEDLVEGTTGTLEIAVIPTGSGTSKDGYMVTLHGSDFKPLNINSTVTLNDLEEGSYSIELTGVRDGCTVVGDNPLSVYITANKTTTTRFDVVYEGM